VKSVVKNGLSELQFETRFPQFDLLTCMICQANHTQVQVWQIVREEQKFPYLPPPGTAA